MKNTILIIEDDKDINEMLTKLLTNNNFDVNNAYSGTEGLLVHNDNIDLILLDLMLPGKNGEDIIKELKQKNNVPIIVMSAIEDVTKKIDLFSLGANDYITKPFGNAELMAGVRAALRDRRSTEIEGIVEGKFHLHDMEIDYARRAVTIAGAEVKLTRTEYNILEVLSHNQGKVLTYAAIIRKIWGPTDDGGIKKLQVNMANIRKKIGSTPGDNKYIINELGVGYRIGEENY